MEGVVGEIRMFAGTFAPRDWAFCWGQILSIGDFSTLYSILGTTYGGDGRTNFAVPDFRGRTAIGSGQGPGLTNRFIGQFGGLELAPLDTSHMPLHGHTATFTPTPSGATGAVDVTIDATTDKGEARVPSTGAFFGADTSGGYNPNPTPGSFVSLGGVTVAGGGITGGSVGVEPSGGGQPHINMQPFSVMHYIICLDGDYPSRN